MPTVYIDVLFFVNLMINALLLYCTAKLLKLRIYPARIICTCILSALYSIFMFLPDFSMFYSGIFKFLFSLLMIALAFNIKGIKLFGKALAVFYAVTIFFGGCVFLIFCFTDLGSKTGAVIKNGVLYFDLPWHILFLSAGCAFWVITLLFKGISYKNTKEYIKLQIVYLGKSTYITALIDTGNTLCDPITHEPVIVAEFESIKEILPPDFESTPSFTENTNLLSKMRIIPYSSIGKENGILLGFKPDRIISQKSENPLEISGVIVGISNTSLSKDKSFQALMPPGIIL